MINFNYRNIFDGQIGWVLDGQTITDLDSLIRWVIKIVGMVTDGSG